MNSRGFTHWRDGDVWLGFFDDYPDYATQGESPEDLKAHVQSLYEDSVSGEIPCLRQHGELKIA
ncbi:MAG: type II toxin-antitoxin system HicB family antitoxin [Verrucomicrobia bacterium]|nr:type II toxin-antitoxin system HicB family antitoxin [Verrucomicrobiota bacterium]